MKRLQKMERADVANEFLQIIASHGRRFFHHEGRVSEFQISERGHVYLIDSYTQRAIYTHYAYRWAGFTNGGTMRRLVESLRDYICGRGALPLNHLGPWHETLCGGDLWGYGDSMQAVREQCLALTDTPPHEED